jgi:hypothetical protein
MKEIEYRILISIAFLAFIVKSIYFIFNIEFGLPPDENFHFKFAKLINLNDFPIPENHKTYRYGSLNTKPYLYHYIISIIFNFHIDNEAKVILLRSLNAFIFLLSCIVFLISISKITDNKVVKTFSIYMYTNILMLTFLSSAISYDISIILISVLIFNKFLDFFENLNIKSIYWMLFFGLIGLLIKLTIIPFLFIVLLVSIIILYINREKWILRVDKLFLFSIPIFLFLCFLNYSHYYGNYFNYSKFNPSSVDVFGEEICLSHIDNYKIFKNFRDTKDSRARLSFIEYLYSHINQTLKTSYGILAHFKYNNIFYIFTWSYVIIMILPFLFVRTKKESIIIISIIFFLFYYLFLMLYNYISYSKTHVFTAALQGRYVFPVVFLYCFLVSYGLNTLFCRFHYRFFLYPILLFIIFLSFPLYIITITF